LLIARLVALDIYPHLGLGERTERGHLSFDAGH